MGDEKGSVLRRLVARTGEPFVRQAVGAAMRMMGQVFVMGRTIDEALARAGDKDNRGFTASFDMLGEAARTYDDGQRYFDSYMAAIRDTGKAAGTGDITAPPLDLGQAVGAASRVTKLPMPRPPSRR